jgi:chromosome segregation ATPase
VHVKDYLQALVDDNKIKVEKIGAGNWYWSFAGEEKRSLQNQIDKADEDRTKVNNELEVLKAKLEEASQATADETDALEAEGMDRKTMIAVHDLLKREVSSLTTELDAYRDSDPQVLEEKKQELRKLKENTDRITNNIYIMEKKLKEMLSDKQQFKAMKKQWYDMEYDAEEEGLRELPA